MIHLALENVEDEAAFGGKARALGAAIRAGLPVPRGVALAWASVDAIAESDPSAIGTLPAALATVGTSVAARSSAIGEDSGTSSFAGIHATILNVTTPEALRSAILEIRRSAHAEAAVAYRTRLGIGGPPRMGVVLQAMVRADRAGVLFTRHPISGADERVIEASWGLGEAVVSGLVTPDSFRVDRSGRVVETRVGFKDRSLAFSSDGGTEEVDVEPERQRAPCLAPRCLARLHDLATACERAFGAGAHDIEWAFQDDELFLLQRRPATTGAKKR